MMLKIYNKSKLFLIILLLILLSWFVINDFQKLPDVDQIQKFFTPESGYIFTSYEVKDGKPYLGILDTKNKRNCDVDLVRDYKFGVFTGDWIFGSDWRCLN